MKFFKNQYQEKIKRFIFRNPEGQGYKEGEKYQDECLKDLKTDADKSKFKELNKNVEEAEKDLNKFDKKDGDNVEEGVEKKEVDKNKKEKKEEEREKLEKKLTKAKEALEKFKVKKGLDNCIDKTGGAGMKLLSKEAKKAGGDKFKKDMEKGNYDIKKKLAKKEKPEKKEEMKKSEEKAAAQAGNKPSEEKDSGDKTDGIKLNKVGK